MWVAEGDAVQWSRVDDKILIADSNPLLSGAQLPPGPLGRTETSAISWFSTIDVATGRIERSVQRTAPTEGAPSTESDGAATLGTNTLHATTTYYRVEPAEGLESERQIYDLVLYDLKSGDKVWTVPFETDDGEGPQVVAVTPYGVLLNELNPDTYESYISARSLTDGSELWKVDGEVFDGEVVSPVPGGAGALAPDGATLLLTRAVENQDYIREYFAVDLRTGAEFTKGPMDFSNYVPVWLSPSVLWVHADSSTGPDRFLTIKDAKVTATSTLDGTRSTTGPAVLSPDQATLYTVNGAGSFEAMDVATGRSIWAVPVPSANRTPEAISAQADRVVVTITGEGEPQTATFDAKTGKQLEVLDVEASTNTFTFTVGDRFFVYGAVAVPGSEPTNGLWCFANGDETVVGVSPDGDLIEFPST